MRSETRRRGASMLALGGAVAMLAAGCASDDGATRGTEGIESSRAAARGVSLEGTWTGHRERISSTEGYRTGTATMVVGQRQGRTFTATMEWSTPEGPVREGLVGAYTPGGALIAGADAEGTYTFRLVSRRTLDYCYSEHGDGYRTTCARLRKQR